MKYKYNATNLIASYFEEHGVKFQVHKLGRQEELVAGFLVHDDSHPVIVKFISVRNTNDVGMRVFGFVEDIPKQKWECAHKLCNKLNGKVRFLEFTLDNDGDINASYDFLRETGDECLGAMAHELFQRTMAILDSEYDSIVEELQLEDEDDFYAWMKKQCEVLHHEDDTAENAEHSDAEKAGEIPSFADWTEDETA